MSRGREGKGSCQGGALASRRGEGDLALLQPPGGVREGLADVFLLEVGVGVKDLVVRAPSRQQTHHRSDRDSHAADAGLAAHDSRIKRDSLERFARQRTQDSSCDALLAPFADRAVENPTMAPMDTLTIQSATSARLS